MEREDLKKEVQTEKTKMNGLMSSIVREWDVKEVLKTLKEIKSRYKLNSKYITQLDAGLFSLIVTLIEEVGLANRLVNKLTSTEHPVIRCFPTCFSEEVLVTMLELREKEAYLNVLILKEAVKGGTDKDFDKLLPPALRKLIDHEGPRMRSRNQMRESGFEKFE